MIIRISERFEIERDNYGWTLHEYSDGISREGLPIRSKRTTYPGRLDVVCSRILDGCGSEASTVAELLDTIKATKAELLQAIQAAQSELPQEVTGCPIQ
jgi:hypothetical protein